VEGAPKAYDGSFAAAEIVAIFLFLFPPWEVEQLACVCDYAEERNGIYLHRLKPR